MNNPIILTKGQTISLVKTNGQNLTNCFVGLGWDFHYGESADLDAFIVECDDENRKVDVVYFGHLTSNDRAIRHTGDNLTGEGDGDDEVVSINLSQVNPIVKKLIVAVNIYTANLSFSEVENAFVRLVDANTHQEFSRYNLSQINGNYYTMYMAEIIKDTEGKWHFRAVGEPRKDKSIQEFVKNETTGSNSTPDNTSPRRGGFFSRLFR